MFEKGYTHTNKSIKFWELREHIDKKQKRIKKRGKCI